MVTNFILTAPDQQKVRLGLSSIELRSTARDVLQSEPEEPENGQPDPTQSPAAQDTQRNNKTAANRY